MDKAMIGMPGFFGEAQKQSPDGSRYPSWSSICDVMLFEDGSLYLSGAGFSAGSHREFAKLLRPKLKALGYQRLRCGKVSW